MCEGLSPPCSSKVKQEGSVKCWECLSSHLAMNLRTYESCTLYFEPVLMLKSCADFLTKAFRFSKAESKSSMPDRGSQDITSHPQRCCCPPWMATFSLLPHLPHSHSGETHNRLSRHFRWEESLPSQPLSPLIAFSSEAEVSFSCKRFLLLFIMFCIAIERGTSHSFGSRKLN